MIPTSKSHRGRWLAIALGLGGAAALGVYVAARVKRGVAQIGPVTAIVTINKPPREVYEFFRQFAQLPTFMSYLESVEVTGERSSRWTAKLPTGGTVTWEADIVEDERDHLIVWQSRPGSTVQTRGRVLFTRAPGRDATEVRVEMQLGVAGATPTSAMARLFATPQVKADMRRLKSVLETGEVLRSDASAHELPHPAQPAADATPAPPVFRENRPIAQKGKDGVLNSLPHVPKLPTGGLS